jgi:hypothetical protein
MVTSAFSYALGCARNVLIPVGNEETSAEDQSKRKQPVSQTVVTTVTGPSE